MYLLFFGIFRLVSHDIEDSTATFEDPKEKGNIILVDTRLIEPLPSTSETLQLIGEISVTGTEVKLLARIARPVGMIDTSLYFRALSVQREYFANREKNS